MISRTSFYAVAFRLKKLRCEGESKIMISKCFFLREFLGCVLVFNLSCLSNEPITSDEAMERLEQGQARFLADKPTPHVIGMKERMKLAMEQHPFAIILTCADSRVTPELIFDQGPGSLFVLRVAGNISEPGVVGSIEYAAKHLRCPLVVVLGHEGCGAVKSAMHLEEVHGQLGALIDQVRLAKSIAGDPEATLRASVDTNVLYHAEDLRHKSALINDLIGSGKLHVKSATYAIDSGRVRWLQRN